MIAQRAIQANEALVCGIMIYIYKKETKNEFEKSSNLMHKKDMTKE